MLPRLSMGGDVSAGGICRRLWRLASRVGNIQMCGNHAMVMLMMVFSLSRCLTGRTPNVPAGCRSLEGLVKITKQKKTNLYDISGENKSLGSPNVETTYL